MKGMIEVTASKDGRPTLVNVSRIAYVFADGEHSVIFFDFMTKNCRLARHELKVNESFQTVRQMIESLCRA